jgi:CheY-like chemotaxis protein
MGETLRGKRILAVDDEADVLDIIKEELDQRGVELDTASSYQEAIEKLSSIKYDLVILDIMGVRGFELLEYAATKETVAIVLTAHALSPESLSKSFNLAAAAYLPKDRLGALARYLEDALALNNRTAWKTIIEDMSGTFTKSFGSEWKTVEDHILRGRRE